MPMKAFENLGACVPGISNIEQPERQRFLQKELAQEEQLLDDWIAFKRETGVDFDAWCKRKGRAYSWMKAYN